jgi:alanine-synthesizing transaminase
VELHLEKGMRMFMERTFAERLQDAMRQRGFKQVDLVREADKYGVKLGKSHMSQYVSGKTVPRAEILCFLANCLQVDADWLLTGEGDSRMVEGNTIHNVGEKNTARKAEDRESAEGKIEGKVSWKGSTQNRVKSGGSIMREFMKSSKLDNVLYDVRGPVVEEANRMEDAGTQVLKLNIGNPAPFGFRAPDEVIYDMRRQLADCEGYSPAKGMFSARKAIMQYAQLKHIPNVAIEDIYTGNGVSELINLSMSALLDSGDEVLVPSPDYPLWTACVTLAGGTAVHYLCDEQSEWYPDIEDIRKKINDRTKAIVIINPNNPTGALYPKEVLQQIVDVAREHQIMIFSDEIYDRLVMDDEEHVSIASLAPDLFCVTFSGLSKSHMIAGFRVGWMVLSGNKAMAKDYILGLNMLSNMRLCSNVPAQSIVQTALGGHQSVQNYIVPGGRIYEQREYIYKALNDIPGITAVKPKAAFYMFPKIDTKKFNIVNDEKFALDLLKEKKILLVHGGGFNWQQPDHFRVVYLPRIEVLKEAAGKIRDFLEHYQQEV